MSLWRRIIRKKKSRVSGPAKHYLLHKEQARAFVHERIAIINERYNFAFNRIAIRDTKSRWGSCSTKKNLNFSYRILFLPSHLADYLIAHELCHLEEFNHGPNFWKLVEQAIPEYRTHRAELRAIRMDHAGKLIEHHGRHTTR